MKKILAILIFIMFCGGAYADVQQAEITHSQYRPHWSMVAPTKWSDVAYKEPIKRGKWVKPVAWVGYVGTLFIVPFPLFMTAKDKNIATNNQWNIFRENFERDLDNCERLYKQERDLLKLYIMEKDNMTKRNIKRAKKTIKEIYPAKGLIRSIKYLFL